MSKNITESVSSILTRLTGLAISEDHVHNDEHGWFYYIPAHSLQKRHPLLMCHYRGPFFVVIPTSDWEELEQGLNPEAYVNESVWSYGRFWGGGSMLGGVHWMPLENGKPGISQQEKVKRYMKILQCRTHFHSCGYMPSQCEKCEIEHCPFSKNADKHADADWNAEVLEVDDRIKLYKRVEAMLMERFGIEVKSFNIHSEDSNVIRIYPGYKKGTVKVEVSAILMVEMLYNPGEYDVDMLVRQMSIEAGTNWYYNAKGKFVPSEYAMVPSDADAEFLHTFWANDIHFQCYAVAGEEKNFNEINTAPEEYNDTQRGVGILEKLSELFHKFFN